MARGFVNCMTLWKNKLSFVYRDNIFVHRAFFGFCFKKSLISRTAVDLRSILSTKKVLRILTKYTDFWQFPKNFKLALRLFPERRFPEYTFPYLHIPRIWSPAFWCRPTTHSFSITMPPHTQHLPLPTTDRGQIKKPESQIHSIESTHLVNLMEG